MWADREVPEWKGVDRNITAKPELRFNDQVWNRMVDRMVEAGINMVVIDLGDGVRYRSHPEIAVRGAWSVSRLKRELKRLRGLGLEPIPKMNFSTGHDIWLGPYARMVSTDTYYGVCRELIAEVIDIFDCPRLFHLGMDEESLEAQAHYAYAVMRQYDLWWHDLYFLVEQVEHGGSRAWVWSDYLWHHEDVFFKKMPRSVMQSNWFYDRSFSKKSPRVRAYHLLEEHKYDQIPTGSNDAVPENFIRTTRFARRTIAPRRLKGFYACFTSSACTSGLAWISCEVLREVAVGAARSDTLPTSATFTIDGESPLRYTSGYIGPGG